MTHNDMPALTADAANVYEELFVPALFQQWAPRVADAALVQPGHRVLDVACGTGVLARAVSARIGSSGSVVGLDASAEMLAVAVRKAPHVEWREGFAEQLPFQDDEFDAVVSQFGLMFFRDRAAAVREMSRVLRRGGRLAVAVWAPIDRTPAYHAYAGLLQRLFGAGVADGLRAPFALGDPTALLSLFVEAGISVPGLATIDGTARFPSLETFIYANAKGWLQLDDDQSRTLMQVAHVELQSFVGSDGAVSFPMPAHIVTAIRS